MPGLQTTTDERRRHTPATVTSLPPTLCVGGPVMTWQNNLHHLTLHRTTLCPTTWRSYRDHRLLWRHFTLCAYSLLPSKCFHVNFTEWTVSSWFIFVELGFNFPSRQRRASESLLKLQVEWEDWRWRTRFATQRPWPVLMWFKVDSRRRTRCR